MSCLRSLSHWIVIKRNQLVLSSFILWMISTHRIVQLAHWFLIACTITSFTGGIKERTRSHYADPKNRALISFQSSLDMWAILRCGRRPHAIFFMGFSGHIHFSSAVPIRCRKTFFCNYRAENCQWDSWSSLVSQSVLVTSILGTFSLYLRFETACHSWLNNIKLFGELFQRSCIIFIEHTLQFVVFECSWCSFALFVPPIKFTMFWRR